MWRLDKYLFKPGNNNRVILEIKRFLQDHPCVKCDLKRDGVLDSPTQAALTSFQKLKRLRVQDGTLNFETYAAIGAEMYPPRRELITLHDPVFRQLLQGNVQSQPQSGGEPTRCEKHLASVFGDKDAYFSDDEDGDGLDLTLGRSRLINGKGHGGAHLYGHPTDASITTNIYIPKGGKIQIIDPTVRHKGNKYVGYGKNSSSTYCLIYYAKLGSLQNVTLAIFHIADFKAVPQQDGRTRIGTLGGFDEGGTWTFKSGKQGKHAHFELYDGLWKSIPGKKPFVKFSGICPPTP